MLSCRFTTVPRSPNTPGFCTTPIPLIWLCGNGLKCHRATVYTATCATTPINTDICRSDRKAPRSRFFLAWGACRLVSFYVLFRQFPKIGSHFLGGIFFFFFSQIKTFQFQVKHGCSTTWHADLIWMTLASLQGKSSSVKKGAVHASYTNLQFGSHSQSGGHSGLHLKSKAFPGNDLLWSIHPCAPTKLNIIVYVSWFMKRSIFQFDFLKLVPSVFLGFFFFFLGWWRQQQQQQEEEKTLPELCDVYAGWGNFSVQAEQTFRPPVQSVRLLLLLPAVESGAHTLTFRSAAVFRVDQRYDFTSVSAK